MKLQITPEDILAPYADDQDFEPGDLFAFGGGVTTEGLEYWYAFAHPEEVVLSKWLSDDGKRSFVLDVRHLSGEHPFRNQQPGDVLHEESDLKYVGEVSRGQALAGVLSWLAKHTDENGNILDWAPDPANDDEYRRYLEQEHGRFGDEIVGLLDRGNGGAFITGVGASIFGAHMRAMQRGGDATYTEF